MTKILSILFTVILLAGSAACSASTPTDVPSVPETSPTETQSHTETPSFVVFSDAVLEVKVRAEMGRPEGPISLSEAAEILELDLSNDRKNNLSEVQMITDISSLKFFPNLFRLNLMSNKIEDIHVFSELSALRILNLSDNLINNISPLSELKLTELMLNNNSITDIMPLTNMKQLRTLDLVGNQITDISGLGDLNKIQNLRLADNPIKDYSPLVDLYANLSKKDFEILSDDDAITFTDPVLEAMIREEMGKLNGDITVAEAKAVSVLNLEMKENGTEPKIHDISSLKYFSNLTELKLNWAFYNKGEPIDLSPLSNMKKLKNLWLVNCEVFDISPLEGLSALEFLDLQLNRIEDISPLAGLTNLKTLSICSNPFTDISPLSNLTSLTELFLFGVQISDITPLSGLINLEMLDLVGTGIKDVSALSNLTKLKMLNQ